MENPTCIHFLQEGSKTWEKIVLFIQKKMQFTASTPGVSLVEMEGCLWRIPYQKWKDAIWDINAHFCGTQEDQFKRNSLKLLCLHT